MKKKKCEVCGRKLGEEDFYSLCRKCQPAYRKGWVGGARDMKANILGAIEEAEK